MAEEFDPSEFDPRQFFETLRKTASVKAGAIVFGEAQAAYYDTLKQHMPEEQAYNMLAHTTENVLKAISMAAGPVVEALLQASFILQQFAKPTTDKTVPGQENP